MNPIEIARAVEERYRRYLKTTFSFRDPDFARLFGEALDTNRLAKGPYLDATPVFKPGATPAALFAELLGRRPDPGFLGAVRGDRTLYRHQEDAIRKISAGRNVVVATGTGSGKTEAFLYPILLDLWRQHERGRLGPGVRALALYPMNALANDQRDRLGAPPQQPGEQGGLAHELRASHSPFMFSYGQYIGATPENQPDRNQTIYAGELPTRADMRKGPPNILLTNYSMLEYLLLRPDDSPLFDGEWAKTWTYLVLDEAHQYRGSKGAEMGMLIRRLKERLRDGGNTNTFRCIATSASLADGANGAKAVADFAAELFGEPFDPADVITGEFQPLPEGGSLTLDSSDYEAMARALNSGGIPTQDVDALLRRTAEAVPSAALPARMGALLGEDTRAIQLKRLISGQPADVAETAARCFPELPAPARVPALDTLVSLMARCRDATGAPLLTGRYHLLLKAMEGAFVSYAPQKSVALDHKTGPGSFEIALCRECGQLFFVGHVEEGKLAEAVRDPGDPGFGATYFRPVETGFDPDPGEDEAEQEPGPAAAPKAAPARARRPRSAEYELCLECGAIGQPVAGCACKTGPRVRVIKEPASEHKSDQIRKCGACGYDAAGKDPVRELTYGTDGPHAVIAQSLYQSLPESERKVLAFADGRQEAAFFAWYFEESYGDLLSRNLMLAAAREAIASPGESVSLTKLARQLRDVFVKRKAYPASMRGGELLDKAFGAVFKELLTDERRISLEGVGLARWQIELPDDFTAPAMLLRAPWSFSAVEARQITQTLLDSMRLERSMEIKADKGVTLSAEDLDIHLTAHTLASKHKPVRAGKLSIAAWDGPRARRVKYLRRVYQRRNPGASDEQATAAAVDAARAVWEAIAVHDRAVRDDDEKILLPVDETRRLNPAWWRLSLIGEDEIVFRCETCGRINPVSINGVCATPRCAGTLAPARRGSLPANHYRDCYTEAMPGFVRSEEHTAQLSHDKARAFQQDFKDGKINLLSCSTTFELGVDLGDLNTVFLRNVPPEAFNYAQRVGRAGRRAGAFGLAVTYCRRNPHDLYHYLDPERVIRGKTAPPTLAIHNAKVVARHISAWALSDFFRANPARFKNVQQFFEDLEHPTGRERVAAHLRARRAVLEAQLRQIVPAALWHDTGLDDGRWIDQSAGPDSRLGLAELEISSDYRAVLSLQESSKREDDFVTAGWAKDRARTIAAESTLVFLSRRVVLPKYGFPVDVVDLDTSLSKSKEGLDVTLQRDLSIAISEFAPTSQLIANKKVWKSYGLKQVKERAWPQMQYRRCHEHNTYVEWRKGDPAVALPCECPERTRTYLIPQFGFTISLMDKPKEPTGKAERQPGSRPYFAGHLGAPPAESILTDAGGMLLLRLRAASPGRMVALSEGRMGRPFYVCGDCGFGSVSAQAKHYTPYGRSCTGMLEPVALGHDFETDVLQIDPLQFTTKEPLWDTLSLAYALAEGAAEALEVPSTDLNATALVTGPSSGSIVLYDNVPGGAGLVARLAPGATLEACLRAALKKVEGGCGCREDDSCYSCLRSYRNQFAHRHLRRGMAKAYLGRLVEGIVDREV
jgi:hypothetical protein